MARATTNSDESVARTYFEIEPAAAAADPARLQDAFRRLHNQSLSFQLECLVVASGDGVDYYIGADAEDARTVDHTLHSIFPDDTTISNPDTDPAAILERLGPAPSPDADADDTQSATTQEAPDDQPPQDAPEESEPPAAAVRYRGQGIRRNDWQMQLQDAVEPERDVIRSPLTSVVDTLANAPDETVVVYQALLEPHEDWTVYDGLRREKLQHVEDSIGQSISRTLFGPYDADDREDLPRSNRRRLAELDAADPAKTWTVNARTYVQGPRADTVARDLANTFGSLDGDFYWVTPTRESGEDAHDVLEAIQERTLRTDHGRIRRLGKRLPGYPNTKPAIITDLETAPAFCFLDGDALTKTGQQALATTPREKSGVAPPNDEQLELYETAGLTLGQLLDEDDERTDQRVALPPKLQPLHVLWSGKTGSGKTVAQHCAIFDNLEATDGPAVILANKGDGMAEDFLKPYYRKYGDFEDVYYFECDRYVPAISFFDISDELEAGVPRATAIEDTIDHYIELLEGIMGEDEFQSKRAEDVIRYLLKAMYDPVYGSDSFTHAEFNATVQRMANRQEPPAVSDPTLERKLAGVAGDRSDVFAGVMQGVAGRIEKATRDRRLARLFDHAPRRDSNAADADTKDGIPSFDFADHIDEDSVIVLDTGGLREAAQREMVLVILSNLWAALRNRDRRRREDPSFNPDHEPDPPLANLYIEEAADIAGTSLMDNLLSQSRSFGLSVTLAMQFPAQLREAAPRTYHELLNNVSTIITGNVGRDRPFAERLATDDMDAEDVANRLRGLRRGQWLTKLPAKLFEDEPRPFLLESADPPAGHPASDEPLSQARYTAFDAALYSCKERTREQAGLTVAQPSLVDDADAGAASAHQSGDDAGEPDANLRPRVDTTLPYTKRLPDHIEYDADRHALTCTGCDAVYDPDHVGLGRALECCPEGEVDPADVPICEANLKLTREERRECEYSDGQLMFLQAVYNAAQLRYEPPMYDLLSDSMLRLREYVGIDGSDVEELLEDGLLRHDTDHPHRLYTVSSDGRSLLGEKHRHGVDHGHGKGDLGESSQHAMGVEGAARWIRQEFVAPADSEVQEVVPYYELDESDFAADMDFEVNDGGNASRLDLAGLDEDGNIVVAVEVERINNDVAEAVPADYDKMAACDPEEAIWITMTQSAGHDVLQALNDSGRVEKTYANTTPPQQFRIDAPGVTEIYPVTWVLDRLE